MAIHQPGIAITIKGFLPTGKTLEEQFTALSIVKTAHETGKGGPVSFNAHYLTAFAKLFGTIRLTGNGAGDPAIVHADDAAFMGVIMPMRV